MNLCEVVDDLIKADSNKISELISTTFLNPFTLSQAQRREWLIAKRCISHTVSSGTLQARQ
jgi:hypothetical protein